MLRLLIVAALAAAPAAADDWKGSGYGGGKSWSNTYQAAPTTDFGGTGTPSQNWTSDQAQTGTRSESREEGSRTRKSAKKGDSSGKDGKKGGGQDGNQGSDGGRSGSGSSDMSLSDARENFGTVVAAYVAKNGADGVWDYAEGPKVWHLRMEGPDNRSVKAAGQGRYAGLVAFRDSKGKKVKLRFTVDFRKTVWTVSSVKRPTESKAHIVK